MKKSFFRFCCSFLLTLLLSACHKEPADLLEGKWQLRTEIMNGSLLSVDTLFYNFDNRVFMIQNNNVKTGYNIGLFGEYTLLDDSLKLTVVDTDYLPQLHSYRWSENVAQRTFSIVDLTASKLTLRDNHSVLIFRKY